MLHLSQNITDQPILSIRTGGAVGLAMKPIINPKNLKIEGWYCQALHDKQPLVLQVQEVRDIIPKGIVVNDHESLTPPDDLVRLKEILSINFDLIGKQVIGVSKARLGKVTDFAVDMSTLYIQKLYVSQPLLKSLTSDGLIIDRTQIVEITNKKIVVQDPLQDIKAEMPVVLPATSGI